MDKKLIYGVLILLFVAVLLGALYIFHYRIKSLETSKLQLQKHIMYHQQVIERYNQIFQSSNSVPNFQDIPVPLEPFSQEERPVQTQPNVTAQPQTPAGMNINSILPMMSSLMSIMKPSSETENDDEPESQDNEAKKELENELENELKELQESIRNEVEEGRVDDTKTLSNNTVKEISASPVSDVKSISSLDSTESSAQES